MTVPWSSLIAFPVSLLSEIEDGVYLAHSLYKVDRSSPRRSGDVQVDDFAER